MLWSSIKQLSDYSLSFLKRNTELRQISNQFHLALSHGLNLSCKQRHKLWRYTLLINDPLLARRGLSNFIRTYFACDAVTVYFKECVLG
jgi:hypothetical protein